MNPLQSTATRVIPWLSSSWKGGKWQTPEPQRGQHVESTELPRQTLKTITGGPCKVFGVSSCKERLYLSYSNCIPHILPSGTGYRVAQILGPLSIQFPGSVTLSCAIGDLHRCSVQICWRNKWNTDWLAALMTLLKPHWAGQIPADLGLELLAGWQCGRLQKQKQNKSGMVG